MCVFSIADVVVSWPIRRKWMATVMVASFTFISPVSSSMIAPASGNLAKEFGITNDVIIALTTSVFVLSYGASPSRIATSSEELTVFVY